MKTAHLSAETVVTAPAETVWTILADCRMDVHWRAGVLSMRHEPPGPLHVGSRTIELLELLGRRLETTARVTELEPQRLMRWVAEEGADVAGERRVEPLPDGAQRVRLELRFRPRGLVQTLLAPIMIARIRANLRADVRRFATLAEAIPAAPRSAASPRDAARA